MAQTDGERVSPIIGRSDLDELLQGGIVGYGQCPEFEQLDNSRGRGKKALTQVMSLQEVTVGSEREGRGRGRGGERGRG